MTAAYAAWPWLSKLDESCALDRVVAIHQLDAEAFGFHIQH
jgi:hypothetical protein